MLNYLVAILRFVSSQEKLACGKLCPESSIGDGECNDYCMNPECNYDSPVHSEDMIISFLSSDCSFLCRCSAEQLTNGVCDQYCNNFYCGFDLGDCGYCHSNCYLEDLKSEVCQYSCMTYTCIIYESNRCFEQCSPGCSIIDMLSYPCKKECQERICLAYYQNTCYTETCSDRCFYYNLGDGRCDPMCLNSECYYDKGDCYCNKDCFDTLGDCLTNETYTDPCDVSSCEYKDGKCGDCSSGCFKYHLGDGICQKECNTESCNFDDGDCGCAPGCSFEYIPYIYQYVQTGNSEVCSLNCLVLECQFGIDFCTDGELIKKAVLNFLVYKDRQKTLNPDICSENDCTREDIKSFLDGTSNCSENSTCNTQDCLFCMGKADSMFENCLRQNFEECLLCNSTMIEGVCYNNVSHCPIGYEDKTELTNIFGNSHWCLKKAIYSTFSYNEIYVNSSANSNGDGTIENPIKSLYNALVNAYAPYLKIFLINKEIDFFIDGSYSVFISDMNDPLNSKTLYKSYELWIIGYYSETEKTKVYWKDNLVLSPKAQRLYIQNIEFIGKYVLKKDCVYESCFYCPYATYINGYLTSDGNSVIDPDFYKDNYSKNCSNYASVNVITLINEAYIENVDFRGFRYQFNSFIKSSGVLNLRNVNFLEMQAKSDGSVILLECSKDCSSSSFTYNNGIVIDIGAGYNDAKNVSTGSFFMSFGTGNILFRNVEFSFNFVFNNLRSSNKGYLLYSKNHLGTFFIEDCIFDSIYTNYMLFIDVSSLSYTKFRIRNGEDMAYSQQHFFMNNIQINNSYSSSGMFYYLMRNVVHNIKITNLSVEESIIGEEGMFSVINQENLYVKDIYGDYITDYLDYPSLHIYIKPRFLNLYNLIIKNSIVGKNVLYIEKFPNSEISNILINGISDADLYDIWKMFEPFKNSGRYFRYIDLSFEYPKLNFSESISITNSANLKIDKLTISDIRCISEGSTLGLSLYKIFGSTTITNLDINNLYASIESSAALTVGKSNLIDITNLNIESIVNLYESIVKFDNCQKISINWVNINNVTSKYTSTFLVLNSESFTLSNFLFSNMSTEDNDGGCLYLQSKNEKSIFKIQSGNFTRCVSSNGKGGAIFLDSLSKSSLTLFQMNDVQIFNSFGDVGSAIYITNYVVFSNEQESEMLRLIIKDNLSNSGGALTDNHFSGALKIDGLEMVGNNQGIYVSYSNELSVLRISNFLLDAPNISNSAIYLTSLRFGSSVYIQDALIYDAASLVLEAYNIKLKIHNMNISNAFQALFFNNQVKCEANQLKITNSEDKAITLSKNSSFFCSNCEFTINSKSIIEATDNSNFTFVNSQIHSNILKSGYLFYTSSVENQLSSFTNCKLTSNSLISGSIIYITSSILTIKDTEIIENEGFPDKIQAIYSHNSLLNIINSTFQLSSSVYKGAFLIYSETGSVVTAENSTFENSVSKGGNIYGIEIQLNIKNCKFLNNTGGDIFIEQSNLTIINSVFKNSVLTRENLGVLSLKNNIKAQIIGSRIESVSAYYNLKNLAYVYDDSSMEIEITDCTMVGSKHFIMAIYAKLSASILLKSSDITQFNTGDYSALTVISNAKGCKLNVIESKISDNYSKNSGGGLYCDSFDLIIEDSEVSSNKASDSGGGIFYSTSNCNDCGVYLLGKTKIFNNSCSADGGGIKWKDSKPFIEDTVLIQNNSAAYGENFASIASNFAIVSARELSDNIISTISNVAPGKKITDAIQVFIIDTYGQIVKTENSLTATLTVNETIDSLSAISGITTFKAQNGILSIRDFILSGNPGSSTYLKLKSENMNINMVRNDTNNYSDSAYFKVNFRNCTKGEQIQASACIDCAEGKYTLQASEVCLNCPTGATCTGSDSIIVKNGYWRSSLESDVIYACDVFEACLKGSDSNELGNCSSGYYGVLCKSCELGYSKTANGICKKCPKKENNIIALVLLSLGILFICFVMVKTTLTSAFSPKSLHSIYIKILTNYLQLVLIVTQFDLAWPPYIIEFFNFQRNTASVFDELLSLDCYISFKNTGDVQNVYYTKLCVITALPIAIILLSYIYWILYSSSVESYKWLKREAFTTKIVIFFLVYPTKVKSMFSNFSCVQIDKLNSYLNENTSIECWDLNHKKYSIIVVIPSIILWVIGIPTMLLILMTKNRTKLHLDYYRVVFGFLYNGYKKKRYYWEIVIMYRKIVLIIITVFKISKFQVLQALNFNIIMLASIYLHHTNRPYIYNQLNSMEMQALNVAAITIYFGLYYLSNTLGEEVKVVLFVFIILGNSYFIFYWIYYMIIALLDIFIKHFPRFRSILKRGDAFEEDFNNEEIVRKGVYFNQNEGKDTYTFFNIKDKTENNDFNYRAIEEIFRDVAKRDIEKLNT